MTGIFFGVWQMIKELARKLAAFNLVDCVIIEMTFRRGQFESGAEILKNYSSMIFLRASSSKAEVLVKMIRPRQEIKPALGSRIQSSEKIWRIFTASEILKFVEAVGDKNKIYQLNPPIVPAFLILETFCAEFPSDFIKLKFKNFITAGEPLSLQSVENKFELSSAGVRKILITAD